MIRPGSGGEFTDERSASETRLQEGKAEERNAAAADWVIEPMTWRSRDVRMHTLTYRSGPYRVKACFALPARGGPFPPLLYCRGGIGRAGMVRPKRMAQFAARGYAVLAPYYRGSQSGEGRDEFGGADREDVYAAASLLPSLPEVRREPPACLGFSRGAIMALLAARDCPELGPVAVWGGVSDLLLTYEERVDLRRMLRRVVGHPVKQREKYLERSPVCWAGEIRRPVLIVHGELDRHVGLEHALRLAEALRAASRPHRLAVFPGMAHVFSPEADRRALDMIFDWFKHPDRQE